MANVSNSKNDRQYFTKETEKAILEFVQEKDYDKKNRIYEQKIHEALRKLAQSLIHTYKLYYTEVSDLAHLEHKVEIFLLERLHKFDPDTGFKAYSYFSRIAYNYLISNNRKNYKRRVNRENVNDLLNQEESTAGTDEAFRNSSIFVEENFSDTIDTFDLSPVDFFELYVEYLTLNGYMYFDTEKDLRILQALIEVFNQQQKLDVINKKAVYLYVREMVNVTTSEITSVVKKLKSLYKEAYQLYLNQRLVIFENDIYKKKR